MKLRYTILYVNDVEAALAFYERAFGLARKLLSDEGDYGELETGAATLSFSALSLMEKLGKSPRSPDAEHPTFEIALETADVAGAFARAVEMGAKPSREPERMPWGQTIAYVLDPHGYLVELCTKVAPVSAAQP